MKSRHLRAVGKISVTNQCKVLINVIYCNIFAWVDGWRRSRSPLWRAVGPALGSSLPYRAASGREGLAKLLRYLPIGGLSQR